MNRAAYGTEGKNIDHGHEIDHQAGKKFGKHASILLKYTEFAADPTNIRRHRHDMVASSGSYTTTLISGLGAPVPDLFLKHELLQSPYHYV